MTGGRAKNVPNRRRGFALPLVVLLSLVVALVAGVVLQREATHRLLVSRQLASYRSHHLSRGVQEILSQWMRSIPGNTPMSRMLDDDGHALDLILESGERVSFTFIDGQGRVRTESVGLSGEERRDAEGIRNALLILTAGNPDPSLVREVGPVRISLASAPRPVLEALTRYAAPSQDSGPIVNALLDVQQTEDLTEAALNSALAQITLENDERTKLTGLLAVNPELWTVRVEVYGRGVLGMEGDLVARFEGEVLSSSSQGSGGSMAAAALAPMGAFLSWREVPID